MKISESYPYPVLRSSTDDYINSSFDTDILIHNSFGEVKVRATFHLENDDLENLIFNKRCVYAIHIECPQTSYRTVIESYEKVLERSIPADRLRGKVYIHSFILANETLKDYTNSSFNPWFQGVSFTLEKGDILAIGEAIEANLFDEDSGLLNLPSIVTVTKALKSEFMEVDLDSNNIVIKLPEYEYNQYALSANSRLKNTILNVVIVPALVYVFTRLAENREDYETYIWYQVLEKIFSENNYKLEDVGTDKLSSLKAVQLVLRKPLKTTFEEIEKLSRSED